MKSAKIKGGNSSNPVNTRLIAQTFGTPVTVWIPFQSSLIENEYLSRLKNDSARVKIFYRLFNDEHYKLSPESMCVITAPTLHNSGGSDEGTAATLTAAFWAASIQMGKLLSPKQLGCRSPSESHLHTWEKRYATQFFVGKYHRMRQQSQKRAR